MDPQDQHPTSEQPVTSPKSNLSRRRLLQGAAVTAAAAAAGSAVVVSNSNSRAGARQLIQSFGLSHASVSGDPSGSTMCFTGSNYTSYSSFTVDKHGNTTPGTFFVWFTAHNVPAGKYTIAISPDPGDSTTPFQLKDPGNNAYLFKLTGGAATDCPSADPATLVKSAHNFDGLFSYTFTGAASDIQARVHIDWDGGSITSSHVYTFNGTMTNNNTSTVVATASVSVTATPA